MLNKEEIDLAERAISSRMNTDVPIVKLEIADHIITDIEKRMTEDSSISFYNSLKISLRNYGGQKAILKTLQSKLRRSQIEVVKRTLKSISWIELTLSVILLLFLLQSGFAKNTDLGILYKASMIPIAYVVYKRFASSKRRIHLLADGILFSTILPYCLVMTCFSVIKEHDTILTLEYSSIVFTLTYIAIIYMLLRHRAVYKMMMEELEVVNKLTASSS